MDRRSFIKTSTGLLLSLSMGGNANASPLTYSDLSFDLRNGVRTLDLYRPASKERLSIEYMHNGVWQANSFAQICWLLRDVRAGSYIRMDPKLIAILDWCQRYLRHYGYSSPIHILSGYRTQHTNAKTEGAAKNSQHLLGKAVDIRLPGVPTEYLGKLFRWLAQGGVGVYNSSEFVHLDTGRLRTWDGK